MAVRALHVEVAWDVVDPRPTRGVHRGMKVRREAEHHRNSAVTSVATSGAVVVVVVPDL